MVCSNCLLKLHYPEKAKPINGCGSLKNKRLIVLPYTTNTGISNTYWYNVVKDLLGSRSINICNFFVTSLVKCSLPSSLANQKHQLGSICKFNLRNEYNVIKPNIVLLMGAETTHNILGCTVKDVRGQIRIINGVSYIATYASKDKIEEITEDIDRFSYALITGNLSAYKIIK